jgi:hypothetical protein
MQGMPGVSTGPRRECRAEALRPSCLPNELHAMSYAGIAAAIAWKIV